MIRATWLIARKDLRIQRRNGSVFILGFVAPLALAAVLNLVFGGAGDPGERITFDAGVVDADRGPIARDFLGVLDEIEGTGLLDLRRFDDLATARAMLDDGDVSAVWLLPEGFSEAVQGGRTAELTVLGDVDAPNSAAFARAVAEGFTNRLATSTLAGLVALDTAVVEPGALPAFAESVGRSDPLAVTAQAPPTPTSLDTATSLTAGMALFFVFFTAGLPLLTILEERSSGTLARLLVAPVPSATITAGKTLAAVILGTISLAALMLSSTVLLGADWGSPVGALLLAVAAVLAATGIMSLAAGAARTPEQAGNAQAIVAIVFALLGGAFVPFGTDNQVLRVLERLTPHGWFKEGLEQLRADGLVDALPALGVLLAMAVATGAVGLTVARSALRR